MIIAFENSIKFIINDDLDPSHDNTLLCDQDFEGLNPLPYKQKYVITKKDGSDNPILVQIRQTLTETVTFTLEGSSETVTTTEYIYDDFKTVNYEFLPLSGEVITIETTSDETVGYTSEPIEIVERGKLKKIQWFKYENYTQSLFDYTHGEVNEVYVDARLIVYTAEGEIDVFDNQLEKDVAFAVYYRNLTLQTQPIPFYLTEQINLGLMLDRFVINDLAYSAEDYGEQEPYSNLFQYSLPVTRKIILGQNVTDTGFDPDAIDMKEIDNIVFEDVSGTPEGTVLAGHSINQVLLKVKTGTVTFKLGHTVGGSEIIRQKTNLTVAMGWITLNINNVPPSGFESAWKVFLTITGGTINSNIQTIIAIQQT